MIDPTYATRAKQMKGHIVVGGSNYGQGSSREHAVLGPQFLGLRVVLAKGFARIHSSNLINFGVLPLAFVNPADYDGIQAGDVLRLSGVRRALAECGELAVENVTRQRKLQVVTPWRRGKCSSCSAYMTEFVGYAILPVWPTSASLCPPITRART